MDALITIQDRDGQQVVSARELHTFLEDKQKFSDWIKKRIAKYGLIENLDYVPVSRNLETEDTEGGFSLNYEKPSGGRPAMDFALTIDAAKELAMVQGNEKGKQARRYFIEAEKQLRQISTQPMTDSIGLQLQQARLLTEHAHRLTEQSQQLTVQHERLAELEQTVQQIMNGYHPTIKRLPARPQMPQPRRELSTRKQIIDLINAYCERNDISQKEAYKWLYDRLFTLYRVNIHGYRVNPADSLLEVAERHMHLDKLYAIVMSELYYREDY